jgi:Skp family chaperone for outer membrane proteins
MKKSCFLFLFILGFMVSASNSVFAQRGGAYIGKIDVKTVFLLHPLMISYSPERHAFKIARDEVSKKRAAAEAGSNQEEVRRLNALMKSITGKINEEEKSFQKKMSALYDKYMKNISKLATGEAGMNRVTYKTESSNAEVSHNAKLTALYAQYNNAEEKVLKLTQFGFSEGYTSPDETEKKFIAILNEIKTYAQRAADQKGVSIVLNTSYKRTVMRPDSRDSESGYVPDEMALGAIFNTNFPPELARDEAAVAGYYSNVSTLTQNWLKNCSPITGRFKSSMLENDVFIGGVDLTADVMAALFKAYKLDPNISNAVIKAAITY